MYTKFQPAAGIFAILDTNCKKISPAAGNFYIQFFLDFYDRIDPSKSNFYCTEKSCVNLVHLRAPKKIKHTFVLPNSGLFKSISLSLKKYTKKRGIQILLNQKISFYEKNKGVPFFKS